MRIELKQYSGKYYQVTEYGTYYSPETPVALVNVLERCRLKKTRIKIFFGDTATGIDWAEENDTMGTLGRSTGQVKVPLLLKNSRSSGGGAILDHCILKARDIKTGIVLYKANNYQPPTIEITESDLPGYAFNTVVNGKIYGRHVTRKSAELLKVKLL